MNGKKYPPFKKMKFVVESPGHSKQIQEALFKLGYKWPTEGVNLAHFDEPYLLGDIDGDVLYTTDPNHDGCGTTWKIETLQTLKIMIKEMERNKMTTKLKTNWAICTTDEQFKAYILTLEALGYEIFSQTANETDKPLPMSDMLYTHIGIYKSDVSRYQANELCGEQIFPDISSFLVYHFSSKKTESEKELEALQEKMNSLQEQIDRVKLSISK